MLKYSPTCDGPFVWTSQNLNRCCKIGEPEQYFSNSCVWRSTLQISRVKGGSPDKMKFRDKEIINITYTFHKEGRKEQ